MSKRWEKMVEKYGSEEQAREEMSKRSKGNKGNPNPHLKGNKEVASQLGKMGAAKRWGKESDGKKEARRKVH